MTQTIKVNELSCLCCKAAGDRIAYILYPRDILADWIESASKRYGMTIVVVTGMDWQNVFSPWPAPGVPKGTPDFKGESPEFLRRLQQDLLPKVEKALNMSPDVERTLVGVSMSGLFALWQWMVCDTFANIASLSGSFWYEGFLNWIEHRPIPKKTGQAYFLLGDQESKSPVKAFDTVGENTASIVSLLQSAGLQVRYQTVPGNHYANPIPRLNAAFAALP